MIINKTSNYVGFKNVDPEILIKDIDSDINNLVLLSKSRIRFGDGTSGQPGENISGQFVSFTSSATPDAENAIAHTIGAAPIGYIILNQDKAASLYDSGTAWTSSNIYLKCNVASVTYTLFLLK